MVVGCGQWVEGCCLLLVACCFLLVCCWCWSFLFVFLFLLLFLCFAAAACRSVAACGNAVVIAIPVAGLLALQMLPPTSTCLPGILCLSLSSSSSAVGLAFAFTGVVTRPSSLADRQATPLSFSPARALFPAFVWSVFLPPTLCGNASSCLPRCSPFSLEMPPGMPALPTAHTPPWPSTDNALLRASALAVSVCLLPVSKSRCFRSMSSTSRNRSCSMQTCRCPSDDHST